MDFKENYDIFISYRRGSGEAMARLLYELLKKRNYNVFFDHKTLSTGEYEDKLLDIISRCKDFIVILSEDCFKVEGKSGRFYMKEIRRAIDSNRKIIPLMIDGFIEPEEKDMDSFADAKTVRAVMKRNGKNIRVETIDGDIDALCGNEGVFLSSTPRLTADEIKDKCENFVKVIDSYSDTMSEELKLSVIKSSIYTLSDEYSASILKSTISRLSNGHFNLRKRFDYNIRIQKNFDFKNVNIPADKYFRLCERLAYSKIFRTNKPEAGSPFWISFATGLADLDEELRDENFFFSENLMIDIEDIIKISELDDESKCDFYTSVMGVQMVINDKRLVPTEIVVNKSGIFGCYDMPDELGELINVSIRFKIPQKYDNSFFFACISEPTYSPVICVEYDEDDFDVDMIPFLTRSLTTKDTRALDGICELAVDNEWIMPISGAIFLIKKVDNV